LDGNTSQTIIEVGDTSAIVKVSPSCKLKMGISQLLIESNYWLLPAPVMPD
jgi:hypothetical protein